MSLLSLTPERLGAEGLAALEKRQGPLVCHVLGVRLRPSERAVLRFVGALGGSCPRGWLNRIAFKPRDILSDLAGAGLVGPCRVGGGRQVVRLTERGLDVLAALPLPGETPPVPHPLRDLLPSRPKPPAAARPARCLPAGAAAEVVEALRGGAR